MHRPNARPNYAAEVRPPPPLPHYLVKRKQQPSLPSKVGTDRREHPPRFFWNSRLYFNCAYSSISAGSYAIVFLPDKSISYFYSFIYFSIHSKQIFNIFLSSEMYSRYLKKLLNYLIISPISPKCFALLSLLSSSPSFLLNTL